MERIRLTKDLSFSKLIHGHWRVLDWKMTPQELLTLTEQILELGIDTIDHADIYGDYECEAFFGEALKLKPSLRQKLTIVSKCGIKLLSEKYPERKHKIYDYSYEHIVESTENSLKNFGTDYLDVLLLHRPSPFFNPEEAARAFSDLKDAGKVRHFGVSNFSAQQFETLNSFTEEPLVTNQIEISPICTEHFENNNIEYLQMKEVPPMAWSPLGGGRIFNPVTEQELRVSKLLNEMAEEMNTSVDVICFAWLLNHPAAIMPILGTGKLSRIETALKANKLNLNLEEWLKIYEASTGVILP